MPRGTNMKRNANGAGTIRKKNLLRGGKEYTYWEARCTVGYDPGTGKQIQKTFTGKTQKEVREKMQAETVEANEGTYQEPSKLTVGEWLDIWLKDYTSDKKYLTIKEYKAQVKTHIKPAIGAVKLPQLAPHMIQRFYNELLKSGKSVPVRDGDGKVVKKDGNVVYQTTSMSAKSVRNIHGVLTKALSTAVSIGYLNTNPAGRVTLPRVEKKELIPLTDDQIKQFLSVSAKDCYEILMKVILFTGMRESEALGLTWDCVDFKAGTVKICKQLQKRKLEDGGATLASTKNGKTRLMRPAPFVMALLNRQWREQSVQKLKKGELWQGWQSQKERETSLVFSNPQGAHLSQTSLRYHFKKVIAEIGAPNCRVHDLRHTFAVLSLQNGDDIKTVQNNLGHATAAFTLDVYGHVSDRMKDASAERMQQYIESMQ